MGIQHAIQLKPAGAILDAYLCRAPLAHALFRAAELRALAGRSLSRPVLDLGCGGGELAALALEGKVDAGIDLCAQRLERARRTGCYRRLEQGDARRMAFADGAFGSVFALSALEHMSEPATVLGEVFRVLRPGGELVATVVLEDLHRHLLGPRLLAGLGLAGLERLYLDWQDRAFAHRTLLPRGDWERMLRERGFDLVASRKVVSRAVTRWWELFLWSAWPARYLGGVGRCLTRGLGWLRRGLGRLFQGTLARQEEEGSVLLVVARKPAAVAPALRIGDGGRREARARKRRRERRMVLAEA
jgi:SAM-dependent methyltransferase